MAENHTTFVVGAGASKEFGLPDGSELRNQIRTMVRRMDGATQQLSQSSDWLPNVAQWRGLQPSPDVLYTAAPKLVDALQTSLSIDDCIYTHSDDRGVEILGKYCIAKTILSSERNSCLTPTPRNNSPHDFALKKWFDQDKNEHRTLSAWDSWLSILFQNLTAQCKRDQIAERLSKVSFVVFNYDRCIEHALEHFVFWKIGRNDMDEARQIVAGMSIVHAYEWVAPLHGGGAAEFGADPNENVLVQYAQNIRTFTDDPTDKVTKAVHDELHRAKSIVFLGFSFLDLNMQMLADPRTEKRSPQTCYGTSLGLSKADTAAASDDIVSWVAHSSQASILLEPLTCADFMLQNRRVFGFTK